MSQPGNKESASAKSRLGLLAGLIVAVVVATTVTYWPVLSAEARMFDDDTLVFDNRLVQNPSLHSAGQILSEVLEPSSGGYYKPLSMISLMVDRAIAGDPQDVGQFRRTSLALHLTSTVLVVVLLYLLFGRPWVAALVGLLFGVHPTAVEAIAWAAERKNLLSACFALWCLVLYVRYTRRPGWGFYSAALVMYLSALLSKPTATPVAALLLLLDYWPLGRLNRRAVLEKVPFLVLGVASAVITVVSQQRTIGILAPNERPALQTLLVVGHNLIFYLRRAFWPGELSGYYPYPEPFDLSNPLLLGCLIGSVVLMVALLISWRWTRALLAGWVFFLLAISPAIGVIGFQRAIAADRFLYLPGVGFLLTLTWLLIRLWRRPTGRSGPSLVRRAVVAAAVLVLVVAEARATREYLKNWGETETLDRYMLSLTPSCAWLHIKLGNTLRTQGRLAEAVRCYHDALAIEQDPFAHHNLGLALKEQGKVPAAIRHLRTALQIKPNFLHAYLAHGCLGGMLMDQGRLDQAIGHFRMALRIRPDQAETHNDLGVLLGRQGKVEEAVAHFSRAARVDPSLAKAQRNLAAALADLGRHDQAIARYREALRIEPGETATRHALAALLGRRGQFGDAAEEYRAALKVNPNDADAHFGLGCALGVLGRADDAVQAFREALRIDPNHAGARQGLETLSAASDKP